MQASEPWSRVLASRARARLATRLAEPEVRACVGESQHRPGSTITYARVPRAAPWSCLKGRTQLHAWTAFVFWAHLQTGAWTGGHCKRGEGD